MSLSSNDNKAQLVLRKYFSGDINRADAKAQLAALGAHGGDAQAIGQTLYNLTETHNVTRIQALHQMGFQTS